MTLLRESSSWACGQREVLPGPTSSFWPPAFPENSSPSIATSVEGLVLCNTVYETGAEGLKSQCPSLMSN